MLSRSSYLTCFIDSLGYMKKCPGPNMREWLSFRPTQKTAESLHKRQTHAMGVARKRVARCCSQASKCADWVAARMTPKKAIQLLVSFKGNPWVAPASGNGCVYFVGDTSPLWVLNGDQFRTASLFFWGFPPRESQIRSLLYADLEPGSH